MSYGTSILRDVVTILNRTEAETSKFGLDGDGIEWQEAACVHANVTWAKGTRALNAGALDAYMVKQVRMRYNSIVTLRSRIKFDGQIYQIIPETFNPDKRANTIQFMMQSLIEN